MLHTFAIFGLGAPEIIVIAVVLLILFGSRLPKVARSLGQSVNEFKTGLKEGEQSGGTGGTGGHDQDSHKT